MHLDAGGLGQRLGREHDQLQRQDDQAEADQDAAEAPDVGRLRASGTARRRRRSAAATATTGRTRTPATIRLVPTSAPSITASAGAVAIRPWPTNAATISAVAVLLWISAVTPSPAANAAKRLDTLCAQHAAQVAAEEPQDAGAHDVRAPDEQRDAGQQVEQYLQSAAAHRRLHDACEMLERRCHHAGDLGRIVPAAQSDRAQRSGLRRERGGGLLVVGAALQARLRLESADSAS